MVVIVFGWWVIIIIMEFFLCNVLIVFVKVVFLVVLRLELGLLRMMRKGLL